MTATANDILFSSVSERAHAEQELERRAKALTVKPDPKAGSAKERKAPSKNFRLTPERTKEKTPFVPSDKPKLTKGMEDAIAHDARLREERERADAEFRRTHHGFTENAWQRELLAKRGGLPVHEYCKVHDIQYKGVEYNRRMETVGYRDSWIANGDWIPVDEERLKYLARLSRDPSLRRRGGLTITAYCKKHRITATSREFKARMTTKGYRDWWLERGHGAFMRSPLWIPKRDVIMQEHNGGMGDSRSMSSILVRSTPAYMMRHPDLKGRYS